MAPEVLQTSNIDCGPACLRSIMLGFHRDITYERVRSECGTSVGGTSLARLEAVARQYGFSAEQVWMPVDHLTLEHRSTFPAICVSQSPGTSPHFTVVWRRVGRWYQVMDPNTGRRWVDGAQLRSLNHRYHVDLPVSRWREWMRSDDYREAIAERLLALGAYKLLFDESEDDPQAPASALSAFDAAVRMVAALVERGFVDRGVKAAELIRELTAQAQDDALKGQPTATIPEEFFSGIPDEAESRVRLAGAVVLRVRGLEADTLSADESEERGREEETSTAAVLRDALAPVSVAKCTLAALLAAAVAFSSYVAIFMVRAYTNADGAVLGVGARMAFVVAVLVVLFSSAAMELWWTLQVRAVGRMLDVRLRVAFIARLRALGRSFLRTRPPSDLAHRVHLAAFVRNVPELVGQTWSALCSLVFATIALMWLFPQGRLLVLAASVLAVALPAVAHRRLVEKDGKLRVQNSRLAQFNLDALMGATTIAAHGAGHALRWSHGQIVDNWTTAAKERLRLRLAVELLQLLVSNGAAVAIVWSYVAGPESSPALLLIAFWALTIPRLGQSLLVVAQEAPAQRAVLARLVEPIAAVPVSPLAVEKVAPIEPEMWSEREVTVRIKPAGIVGVLPLSLRPNVEEPDSVVELPYSEALDRPLLEPQLAIDELVPSMDGAELAGANGSVTQEDSRRVSTIYGLALDGVSYRADDHNILRDVDLFVAAGSHVAIVGPSGAGKSTLLSLALGWTEPTSGSVQLDGRETNPEELQRRVGWLDPSVTLWDDTLLHNIRYGAPGVDIDLREVVVEADLQEMLARRPLGYHTCAGENGRQLSGGEGQRVRLARTLTNSRTADILVLDEPFRGLSRDARAELMTNVRRRWRGLTILCATHDIATACQFDRVVVVEGGAIVEDGDPTQLLRTPSVLGRLLNAEREAFDAIWSSPRWRHLRMDEGRLQHGSPVPELP